MKQKTNQPHHHIKQSADVEASFITVTLKGGHYDGQTMRVPHDEFYLQLTDRGRPVAYSRFNYAPVFHHEAAIVQMLGGAK